MSIQFVFGIISTVFIFLTSMLPSMLALVLFKYQTRNKKSPISIELLRSPGESLKKDIDEISENLFERMIFLMVVPIVIYSFLVGQYVSTGKAPSLLMTGGAIFVVLLYCIWQGKKLYTLLIKRNHLRLGYGCEVATGQGLALLAKSGFNIFHDFPANQDFNIDHIAVGPQGVFAVETKGRSKAVKSENKNWFVNFDGDALSFPFGKDEESIDQARRQARWLSNWIEKATAEKIHVIPVVSIPGWFVTLPRKRTDVKVGNGKNFSFLANAKAILSEKQIQRISFQIEEKCRTVQVNAYIK